MNVHALRLIAILITQAGNGFPQIQQPVVQPHWVQQAQPVGPQQVQQVGPQQVGFIQLFRDLLNYKIRWLNQIRGNNRATGPSPASSLNPHVMTASATPIEVFAHSQQVQNNPQHGAAYPQQLYQNHASPQVYYGPQGYPQQAYQNAFPQGPQGYSQQTYQTHAPSQTPSPQGPYNNSPYPRYPQPPLNQQQPKTTIVDYTLEDKNHYLHSGPVPLPYSSNLDESQVDNSQFHYEPHLLPKPAVQQVVFQPLSSGPVQTTQSSSLTAQSPLSASQPSDHSQIPVATSPFSSAFLTADNPQHLNTLTIPSPALQQSQVATLKPPLSTFHTLQSVSQTDQVAPVDYSLQSADPQLEGLDLSTVSQPTATPLDSYGTFSLSKDDFDDYRK